MVGSAIMMLYEPVLYFFNIIAQSEQGKYLRSENFVFLAVHYHVQGAQHISMKLKCF